MGGDSSVESAEKTSKPTRLQTRPSRPNYVNFGKKQREHSWGARVWRRYEQRVENSLESPMKRRSDASALSGEATATTSAVRGEGEVYRGLPRARPCRLAFP